MNTFFRFIANTTGRIVRIVAGLLLIAIGILVVTNNIIWFSSFTF